MDFKYLSRRYSQLQNASSDLEKDDLLYRIGSHVGITDEWPLTIESREKTWNWIGQQDWDNLNLASPDGLQSIDELTPEEVDQILESAGC